MNCCNVRLSSIKYTVLFLDSCGVEHPPFVCIGLKGWIVIVDTLNIYNELWKENERIDKLSINVGKETRHAFSEHKCVFTSLSRT